MTNVIEGCRFHYRAFLLEPGTLFTLASLMVLIVAIIVTPAGLVNSQQARTPLHFVSALVGSLYISIQGSRQNLVFSLGVLVIAIGLAIPGILSPVTGALLHELSSIPVIANSARLIGVKEQG